MLSLTRYPGQSIEIGAGITVTVVKVDRRQVEIGITAPGHVGVYRTEIAERIRAEGGDPSINLHDGYSPELLDAAPAMLDMLYRYAHECAECGGTAELPTWDGRGSNVGPCHACKDIRDLIDRAAPNGRPRPKRSQPVAQEDDDDLPF